MGILETAIVVLVVYGIGKLASLADDVSQGPARQREAAVPLTDLAAQLQPPDPALRVSVVGDTGPGEHGTSFRVEGVWTDLSVVAAQAPSFLLTGDPAFDGALVVRGDAVLVSALLDAETRRLLYRAARSMEPGATLVARGVLTVTIGLSHRVDAQAVLQRGREALVLAQRLREPADVAARLTENVRNDPLPGVRLRNLEACLAAKPRPPVTDELLRIAAADGDPGVRLRAALALGQEGLPVLAAVAEDVAADDDVVGAAIEGLGAAAPFDLVARVLRRAVGVRSTDELHFPRTARACVAALGMLGGPAAVSRLAAVMVRVAPLADDAARALQRIGGPAAEEALIAGLAADRPETRLAVIPVLAEMGTAAAVAPLMDAERGGGDLGWRARWAITQIQSRLAGAAGAVSLAGDESGQLSLARDGSGGVSLTPPPGGEREPPR